MSEVSTEKIKQYLLSDDIEMVKMGALLLQQNYPEKEWRIIMAGCHKLSKFAWSWDITDKGIKIYEYFPRGIWEQLEKTNVPMYDMKNFDINILKDAIGKFEFPTPNI